MRIFAMGEKVFFKNKVITVLFSLLFLLSVSVQAFANGSSDLVNGKWLSDNLKDTSIRIIYVAAMSKKDKADFDAKHIPGAAYLSIGGLMNVIGNGSVAPDKAKFEELMGKLGISNDSHVVLYGSGGGNPFITGAFWLMKYNGHSKVSYLDGGAAEWNKAGLTTTGKASEISPAKYTAAPDASIYADADYVLNNIKNSKVVIVDTRAEDEFNGTNAMNNKRTGHVPGAVNLNFYPTNLTNGVFKSVKDLKAAYEAKGVTMDKEIIIYCQGGIRAAHTYFVLKHLLKYPNVRNYVGSWGEWGNRLDTAKYPLEK